MKKWTVGMIPTVHRVSRYTLGPIFGPSLFLHQAAPVRRPHSSEHECGWRHFFGRSRFCDDCRSGRLNPGSRRNKAEPSCRSGSVWQKHNCRPWPAIHALADKSSIYTFCRIDPANLLSVLYSQRSLSGGSIAAVDKKEPGLTKVSRSAI